MSESGGPSARNRWLLLLGLGSLAAAGSVILRSHLDLEWSVASLRAFVANAGFWGPALYVAILTFRFAVLVPSSILLIGAGLCFGAVPGAIYATLGLTLSALLKFAVASLAGRDVALRQLPERWRSSLSIGDRRSTVGGLALICAYPFGPKHVFQFAAILSGMTFWKYALAVSAGAMHRASLFSVMGESLATGQGFFVASTLLAAIALTPLLVPRWRAWLLAKELPA